jgi:mono/diheme cytochrome c family protein
MRRTAPPVAAAVPTGGLPASSARPNRPLPFGLALPGVALLTLIGAGFAAEPPAAGQKAAATRALYKQRCQRCHEADGSGSDADTPNFTDPKWQRSRTDLQLLVSILDGKGTAMPGFRGKITDAEGRELVVLVRSFPIGQTVAADDFPTRFRALQEELASLQKQFRDVAESGRKGQTRP